MIKKNREINLSTINPKNVPPFPWIKTFIYCHVYEVHDGDTIKVLIEYKGVFFNISIRIAGIDCPEISRCSDLEREAGLFIKYYLKDLIENQIVKLYAIGWDKYGGRIVADVYFNNINIARHLLTLQYAKPYTGKEVKQPWKTEELNIILKNKIRRD